MSQYPEISGTIIGLYETVTDHADRVAGQIGEDATRVRLTIATGILAQAVVDLAFAHQGACRPRLILSEATREVLAEVFRAARASTLDLEGRPGDPGVTVQ